MLNIGMTKQLTSVSISGTVYKITGYVVHYIHANNIKVSSIGESVEENANVVVRLLIRRPECFGPALRGEGGAGLLAAMEDAIKISEDPARDGPTPKKDRRFMYCIIKFHRTIAADFSLIKNF